MKREQSQSNADGIATDHVDTANAALRTDEPASRTLRSAHESSRHDYERTTYWRGR